MELPETEQKEYLGELIHACISSNWGYEAGKEIISFVKMQGKFIGVKIGNDAFRDEVKNWKFTGYGANGEVIETMLIDNRPHNIADRDAINYVMKSNNGLVKYTLTGIA
jgi:hypothetical protein